ncbi:membrane-bound lytic murein transglycosylase MltF [Methylotenera sp.]|uniref:membrane-bound lytic murein transglycosylase MltF n=1 Tax=Methylotenera sp. TaxID=2051956 RepID=UPI0024889963|nr:membrane-bound lytic murein transglycosylase MltF [Methylotenera sp.]MDI1300053.1 membrane-bound lytic murein transglycosylase MltF [Methylotenera sp.]
MDLIYAMRMVSKTSAIQLSHLMRLSFFVMIGLLVAACDSSNNQSKLANKLNKHVALNSHELVFVTHNGPATYYLNGDNEYAGIEYDLATLFVKKYAPEYQIKFLLVNSISEVIPTLLKGQANIAAANLSVTHLRKELVQFSKPYQETQQQLIYDNETNDKPRNLAAVVDKTIAVPAGTSFAERLSEIQKDQPKLRWQALRQTNSELLLDQVASGILDFTIADSHLVAMMQNYYPNLSVGMALGKPENIAWALPKNADPQLVKKVNKFFEQIRKDGTLRNLLDRYYGSSNRLNTQDITAFLKLSNSLLPKYQHLFKQAQETTGIDWRLLAAVSYRESHWNTFNTSPTGVRGLMMLTESTADLMGVTDRLDPKQSVPAGAKYIVKMIETVPDRIPEPDRTYMALAAYNIGYAHVEDARVLAKRLNLNPDRWADIKKTLVMLNDPEYYTTLKYGYASGGAPVIFVESIRSYQRILERYQPSHTPSNNAFKIAQAY